MRSGITCALLALVVGCTPSYVGPPPPSTPSRLLSEALPAFRGPTVRGDTFDSGSARGRWVVLDFFAEYCQPCHRTLPSVQRFHQQHPDVIVVGVSLDQDEAAGRRMAARHGVTFPVVLDSGNVIAGRFRVTELPMVFVADGTGMVRWVGGPLQPAGALERAVAALVTRSKNGEIE